MLVVLCLPPRSDLGFRSIRGCVLRSSDHRLSGCRSVQGVVMKSQRVQDTPVGYVVGRRAEGLCGTSEEEEVRGKMQPSVERFKLPA